MKRFTQNDRLLADKVKSLGKSFFFIRTHIDVDYGSQKRKRTFNEEEMLKSIREDCFTNLKGSAGGDVFLISNLYPTKWDFALLTQAILDVLPFRQRECLTLSLGVLTSLSTDMLKRKAELLRGEGLAIIYDWEGKGGGGGGTQKKMCEEAKFLRRKRLAQCW